MRISTEPVSLRSLTANLQRELVQRRGWLTLDQYGLAQSLAKVAPGTGILAFSAATAWMLRRWPGGLRTGIAVASFAVFSFTRIDSVWVILAVALAGFLSATLGAG